MQPTSESPRQVIDRIILFRLRFVPSQVRRKNKDAPNLGHPSLYNFKRPETYRMYRDKS
jgi:hypothetical protein